MFAVVVVVIVIILTLWGQRFPSNVDHLKYFRLESESFYLYISNWYGLNQYVFLYVKFKQKNNQAYN